MFPTLPPPRFLLGWASERLERWEGGKEGCLLPPAGTCLRQASPGLCCLGVLQASCCQMGHFSSLTSLSFSTCATSSLSLNKIFPILFSWLNFAWSRFHKVGSNVKPFLKKESFADNKRMNIKLYISLFILNYILYFQLWLFSLFKNTFQSIFDYSCEIILLTTPISEWGQVHAESSLLILQLWHLP